MVRSSRSQCSVVLVLEGEAAAVAESSRRTLIWTRCSLKRIICFPRTRPIRPIRRILAVVSHRRPAAAAQAINHARLMLAAEINISRNEKKRKIVR